MVTVLVLDDSKTFNRMIASLLDKFGYKVVQAFDISHGKEILLSQYIDYIFLDMNLPDGSGELIIDFIQEKNLLSKIIVMTGSEDVTHRDELFKKGIIDYFIKTSPVKIIVNSAHSLIQTLETHKNTNILTIDDSKFVRSFLKNILHAKGYNIFEASSAAAGKKILETNEIHLILLDLIMPDMDGMGFLELIKSDQDYYTIPVIVVSGDQSRENYSRVLKQGANDFIKKPFIIEEILLKCDIHIKAYLHYTQMYKNEQLLIQKQELINAKNKEIKKNNNYLRNLIEASIDPLMTIDNFGKITDANQSAVNITGIAKEELIGSDFSSYFIEKSRAEEYCKIVLTKEKIIGCNLTLKHQDGTLFNVLYNAITYNDENNEIAGVLATARDITELIKLREESEHTHRVNSMSNLLVNIAHHWRQPLSVISTLSSGLVLRQEMDMLTDTLLIDSCNQISEKAQSLSDTINDFEFLFKFNDKKELFSLKEFMKLILINYDKYINETDTMVVANIEDIEISTYKVNLEQIIVSILNNIKEHSIGNKLIMIDMYQEQNSLILKIKDGGGVLGDDILSKFFEPYFTTKHQTVGKGLGLFMIYQMIINTFNGQIEANNITYSHNGTVYTGLEVCVIIPSALQ